MVIKNAIHYRLSTLKKTKNKKTLDYTNGHTVKIVLHKIVKRKKVFKSEKEKSTFHSNNNCCDKTT